MASYVYECMFILDAKRYARDPNGVAGLVPTLVEKSGGEILASRLWNEQKLAYPIGNHRKGAYWLSYFRMDSMKLDDFNRACTQHDTVLRNLVLKVDSRLVDTLVSHAKGEKPAEEPKTLEKETAPKAEAKTEAKAEAVEAAAPATEQAMATSTEDAGGDAKKSAE